MTSAAFISFLIYTLVALITPGPNNILLATSGINFGFKRSIPHIIGASCGFALMVGVVGLGVGSLLRSQPLLYECLKIAGIGYLLFLAYSIYQSPVADMSTDKAEPMNFIQAALFQWVNPKACVTAMGAVTAYLSSGSPLYWYVLIGVVCGVAAIFSCSLWTWVGEKLQAIINEPKKLHYFNAAMAALLALSVVYPIIESIQFFSELLLS